MLDYSDRSGKWLDFRPPFHPCSNRHERLVQVCFTCIQILEKSRINHRADVLITGMIQDRQLELHVDDMVWEVKRFSRNTFDNGILTVTAFKESLLQSPHHPVGIKGFSQRRNFILQQCASRQIIIETLN